MGPTFRNRNFLMAEKVLQKSFWNLISFLGNLMGPTFQKRKVLMAAYVIQK